MVNAGLDVLHGTRRWQRFNGSFECHTCAHVGLGVAQFNIGLRAVEHGGCNGQVTLFGITIGHFTDVHIDAKNFLNHHHRSFGRCGRCCNICRKLRAIGCCELNNGSHEFLLKINV